MTQVLLVGAGGAAGSIVRYLCQRSFNTVGFPYGTLTVNILGCLVIGILWGLVTRQAMQEPSRLLLMTGFCGGFTTFSAFSYEGIQMLTQGKIAQFILYTSISVTVGLVATFAGYKCFQ